MNAKPKTVATVAAYEFKVGPHEFDGKRVFVMGGTKGIGQQ
jgi:hypothetical protein